ncbi:MAG: energy-coupling factor ABC transporter ATP-binding protein [Treponema sp.]|jgi:biotin transport system ATP-binding protein|nr:energy-coupling factor ABC transporter ATP-binding protein [Treponema sp.]
MRTHSPIPDPRSPVSGPQSLFSIRSISKTFPASSGQGTITALDDLNFDIHEGQCLMIAGSNGSGKTLLMRIIAGLLEPDGGDVFFHGLPLYGKKNMSRNETNKRLRRELGLVLQDADAQIVGETVMEDAAFGPENLGFSASDVKAAAEKALSGMGLIDKKDNSPRQLSGGEKRRLAIAGVTAMGCNTVIMDEPFANLDWPGVAQTLAVIRNLKNSGKTLIVLTHELEKALALADRLLILHKGKVRADSSPAEVLDALDPAWGVRDPRKNYTSIKDCSWLEN